MNKILRYALLTIFFAALNPASCWADFFGKLEPQLIQVVDGKKADYKKPVTYPNMLKIKQTPLMISNSSFTLAYEITLENDDNVYCTGEVKLVCFDPKTKRPYKMPDDIKSLLENA
jgi:acyl-CoA thioesterase FadM